MRALLCLLLTGCVAAPAAPEPAPVEPLSSGVTLYVIDTWDDFLEDGMDLTNAFLPPSRAGWMGEQALRIALRGASRGRKAILARRQYAGLREGDPVEFFPDREIHYMELREDGGYQVRQHGELAGFHLILSAEIFEPKYIRLKYDVRLRRADPFRLDGPEAPALLEDRIDQDTQLIPLGGSLVLRVPRNDGKVYLVLVHVASVEPRGR